MKESSPYTWGVPLMMLTLPVINRIIPIYMGSTNAKYNDAAWFENHPHIHGEYLAIR